MIQILGQGLAGTVLAWQCHRLGVPFTIHDADESSTASKVAAGLVTPIIGRRYTVLAEMAEYLADMRQLYAHAEQYLAKSHFEERKHVRIMRSAIEADLVVGRRADKRFAPYLDSSEAELDPAKIRAPFGAVSLRQSGVLRVADFLASSRDYFASQGCFHLERLEFLLHPEPGISRISCLGPWALRDPALDWLPLRFAHGDILEVEIPDLEESRIINGECWLLPIGQDRYLAGSTYLRGRGPSTQPSAEGRAELESRLRALTPLPFRVLDHRAAIRPVSPDRQPIAERHPSFAWLYYLNGLGSRGALLAPRLAGQLLRQVTGQRTK